MTALFKKPKQLIPTTSAQVARMLIFQSTRSPVLLTGDWVTTDWGKARIKGRLGQRHADVMEITQRTALQTFTEADGRVQILTDPYTLRRALASGKRRKRTAKKTLSLYSSEELNILFDDLRNADVEWEINGGKRGGVTKIVNAKEWATITSLDPLNPGQERRLWKITLSAPWAALMGDIGLWYDPTAIIHMKNSISKAVARLLLGHDRKKWHQTGLLLETVLDQLKIPRGQGRWDAKRRLAEDMAGFGVYGLEISDGHIIDTRTLAQTPGPLAQTPGLIGFNRAL